MTDSTDILSWLIFVAMILSAVYYVIDVKTMSTCVERSGRKGRVFDTQRRQKHSLFEHQFLVYFHVVAEWNFSKIRHLPGENGNVHSTYV